MQVYLSFDVDDEEQALKQLEVCQVRIWMARNSLKLNDSKTEFIILVSIDHITIGNSKVVQSKCVRNIGTMMDSNLKFDKQVKQTCKSAWYSLYEIAKISKYLNEDQLISVFHAFVVTKLDMNDSLLGGSPDCLIRKLQSVQNAAAKLIYRRYCWDKSEPPLKELHWLPVSYRIKFKILLLVYKSLNNRGPMYLKELLIPYTPP